MKKQSKLKYKFLGLGLAIAATVTSLGVTAMIYKPNHESQPSYAAYQSEWSDANVGNTLLNSPSFDIGSSTSLSGNSLSDWKAINYDSNSKGMIISVNDYTFNSNQKSFALKNNPGKRGKDNHILMINSLIEEDDVPHLAHRGYQSKSFTLSKNSYYKISVDAKTSLDGFNDVTDAYASIYINGIKDRNNKDIKLAYEGISGDWKTYNFFIATGSQDQNVTIDLYLGKTDNEDSFGVAFFDEVKIEQFSNNAFISACLTTNEYNFEDNYQTNSGTLNKFMVSALAEPEPKLMESYKNYNFDFEKEEEINSTGKNSNWKVAVNSPYAKAKIMDLTKEGQQDFEEKTGYDFVGNDYSYSIANKKENEHGLVLYTEKDKSAYFAIETVNSIKIQAHAVYKISMNVKFSEITGSLYLNVIETDEVIKQYGLKESDITLQTGSTSGLSSNASDRANNDYTEISFYVKGRTFYDSNIKLQIALGNSSTTASGCAVVDSIKVEYAPTSQTTDASNFLDLGTITDSSSSNFTNRFFNNTEVVTEEFSYPLSAKNWTKEQEDNDNVVSGIIYLENEDHYKKTYSNYDWATSYPGNPRGSDAANNLYMFHNGEKSYQSITSEDLTLAKNSYYGITFDYKIASSGVDKAYLTVEVVDNNDITLFKEPIYSVIENTWSGSNNFNIYFHTALTSAHTVKVKIYFGENENGKMVEGTAYIDNFNLYTSDEFTFNNEVEKTEGYAVDLTDYMLNLGDIGYDISDARAYSFNPGVSGNAIGGIVSGKSNEFGVENENNLLVLSARKSPSTSSLTSKFNFDLASSSYYKLTFSLQTISGLNPHEEEKDHECKYGVSIGLSGFEKVTNLLSNDEFTDYTIYIYASSSQTPTLEYSLVMDKHSWGSAYLTNINFEESSEDEYKAASENKENFEKTVFTSKITDTAEPEEPSEEPKDSSEFDITNWIVIPSIITALAIIIAIVGWLLRKIKIKKIEKVKQESYDRQISLNDEVILSQAIKERDAEVEQIKKNLDEMQHQKQLLEDDHKEMIKKARLSQNGKVTKETEHEFKSYSSKMTRLQEKIEILQEHLTKVQNPQYLASIQRRIELDETKRQRDAIKAKEQELKNEKKTRKDENK